MIEIKKALTLPFLDLRLWLAGYSIPGRLSINLPRGADWENRMNRAFLIAATLSLAATSQVLAADLPAAAPRQPVAYKAPPPVFSWTGFYLGINGGYGFGESNWFNTVDGPTGHFNAGGFLLGGTLGANYQIGSFVIGLEGDGDWNDANGSTSNCLVPNCTTRSDWLATIRGRAGYAVDRVLFYGTGGVAFGDVEAAAAGFPFASTTQTGWTAGAGVEWAFLPNWTAKLEYLYVDLGHATCPVSSCQGSLPDSVAFNENIVRAGINYKFGW
jgi:outer membrane immunogenic protein